MEENVRAHRDCVSFIFCLVPIKLFFQVPTGAVAPVEDCQISFQISTGAVAPVEIC